MAEPQTDGFSPFDELLRRQDIASSPWLAGKYVADLDLLHSLLAITLGARQRSGRVAKAFDAWIAHELRRAGFDPDAVWPRTRRPRILSADLAGLAGGISELVAALEDLEAGGEQLAHDRLRQAIKALDDERLGGTEAYILGDFYAKQVDVVISSWRSGPELLVSTKTMLSSYSKNLKNRHEEAVGEVDTLRRRHPMPAMGFAFLVRNTIYEESPGRRSQYSLLRDILMRLRRPGETFDATMLLVAEWDDQDPAHTLRPIDQPDPELGAARFFADLIGAVMDRTPGGEHNEVRLRRDGEPKGGLPDPGMAEIDDLDAELDDEL